MVRARVRAVSLDAAGTLIAPARPVAEVYAETAREVGVEVSPAALGAAFPRVMQGMPALAFPGLAGARLLEAERGWWRSVVGAVLERAGDASRAGPIFERLFARFAEPGAWRLEAGVPEALERLRGAGLRLVVVSNFDSRLLGLLAGLGIAGLFEHVVYSSAAGYAKPDQRIFGLALARLGLPPGSVVHVGDRVDADLEGARDAGMKALLVGADRRAPRSACVASLAELPARLGVE